MIWTLKWKRADESAYTLVRQELGPSPQQSTSSLWIQNHGIFSQIQHSCAAATSLFLWYSFCWLLSVSDLKFLQKGKQFFSIEDMHANMDMVLNILWELQFWNYKPVFKLFNHILYVNKVGLARFDQWVF